MKKKAILFLLITLISNCYIFGQQDAVELKIKEAKYKIGTSTLIIDLEFINTTKDTLYLLKPQNIFFDKHYQFNVIDYPQLSNYPYNITVESNKKCSDELVVRGDQNLSGEKSLVNDDIFIIYPDETKVFKEIIIEFEDIQFCNIGKYSVKILYNLKIDSKALPLTENSNKIINHLSQTQNNIETKSFKCSALKIRTGSTKD